MTPVHGITLSAPASGPDHWVQSLQALWQGLQLTEWIHTEGDANQGPWHCRLHDAVAERLTPQHDTHHWAERQTPDERRRAVSLSEAQHLQRDLWVSLLCAPVPLTWTNWPALESALRVRTTLSQRARTSAMDFQTETAHRPASHWRDEEELGFVLQPGADLVQALLLATQPALSGEVYAFSCYRATEHLVLLALATEAQAHAPQAYARLLAQWSERPLKAWSFQTAYLQEIGGPDDPLPLTWFVPGDRYWFRNPDVASAAVEGYEGSWVIYLGRGEFSNFWQSDQPYTLDRKLVELHHWRHGLVHDAKGLARIDEDRVSVLTQQTLQDAQAVAAIRADLFRLRDPLDVDGGPGGAMDGARDAPIAVHALPH